MRSTANDHPPRHPVARWARPAGLAVLLAAAGVLFSAAPAAAGKKKKAESPPPAPAADAEQAPTDEPGAPDAEQEVVREVAARQAKRLAAAAAEQAETLTRLLKAGGLAPSTMTEPGAVAARLDLASDWCRSSAAVAEMLTGNREELERELVAAGVSPDTASALATKVAASPSRMATIQIRVNEAQTCLVAREQMQLLADHPWRWDDEGQHVVFTDPADQAAAKRHAELGGKLALLDEERTQLVPQKQP